MAEKEIPFEEIREGDKIRMVSIYEGGFVTTREGVAEYFADSAWHMMGYNHRVAYKSRKGNPVEQVYVLVERKEVKDHIVVSTRVISREIDVCVPSAVTKEEAERLAGIWNEKEAVIGDRRIYRAVKVS